MKLSMAAYAADHNSTLSPDLFYFSYQKAGSQVGERIVSFCSTALFPAESPGGHCFLGKGQRYWSKVQAWAAAHREASMAGAASGNSRRLHYRHYGQVVGELAGRRFGGKVGASIG